MTYVLTRLDVEGNDVRVLAIGPPQYLTVLMIEDAEKTGGFIDNGYDLGIDWEVWGNGGLTQWKIHEV